jgi:hypothetical protein
MLIRLLLSFPPFLPPSLPPFSFDQQLDWSSQERIFTIMIGNLISRLDDPSVEGFLGKQGGRQGGREGRRNGWGTGTT